MIRRLIFAAYKSIASNLGYGIPIGGDRDIYFAYIVMISSGRPLTVAFFHCCYFAIFVRSSNDFVVNHCAIFVGFAEIVCVGRNGEEKSHQGKNGLNIIVIHDINILKY